MSEKQNLARQRNWMKARILCSMLPENANYITTGEKWLFKRINAELRQALRLFEVSGRKLGLKIPVHKCWSLGCRNKVIYRLDPPIFGVDYCCKKHVKDVGDIKLIPLNGN